MAEAQPQAETINYRGQLYERIGGRPTVSMQGRKDRAARGMAVAVRELQRTLQLLSPSE